MWLWMLGCWFLYATCWTGRSLLLLAAQAACLRGTCCDRCAALPAACSSGRFLLMYLAAAVAGNVASFYGSAAPSLGASGAIFGIGGALAMYFYRNK